jgi:hypothetical protein
MATWDTVREILQALPGTALDPPSEHAPAWRVNGKVLTRYNPRLRVPEEWALRSQRGEVVSIIVYDPAEREALLRQEPSVFFITPHWEGSPSVLAWLADVPGEQLRELLTDAWRARAPKRLVRQLESG